MTEQRPPVGIGQYWMVFLRPTQFFGRFDLRSGTTWMAAAWIVGVGAAIDRIDWNLTTMGLGRDSEGTVKLAQDWFQYWPVMLIAGATVATLRWWIGGWWYHKRLTWSSAGEPDVGEARLVYTYSALVSAVPTVAYALYCTAMFPDYLTAWQSESATVWLLQLVTLAAFFWSYAVSYKGVRARFDVQVSRARLWFLILPVLFGVVVSGLAGYAVAVVGDHPSSP